MKWGRLQVQSLGLEPPDGHPITSVRVICNGQNVPAKLVVEGRKVRVQLDVRLVVDAWAGMVVEFA